MRVPLSTAPPCTSPWKVRAPAAAVFFSFFLFCFVLSSAGQFKLQNDRAGRANDTDVLSPRKCITWLKYGKLLHGFQNIENIALFSIEREVCIVVCASFVT